MRNFLVFVRFVILMTDTQRVKRCMMMIIIKNNNNNSHNTSFLFQRLSMLIQRFNSVLITDSFCFSDEDPDLLPPVIFVFSL